MEECKICKKREADKRGSHIVPHFLLKRIDNEEGNTDRDKEFGFAISELGISSYFGRSIQPEKIEKNYGEVNDEVLSKNLIPLIEDNIFCKDCEIKLGIIENAYASIIKEKPKEENNYNSFENSKTAFLFWTSIVWRLSIAKYSGFKLIKENEEKLHSILNIQFSKRPEEILAYTNPNIDEKLSYKLLRSIQYSDKNSTLLFCEPDLQNPYMFVIDEFILIVNFDSDNYKIGFEKIDPQLELVDSNNLFEGEITRSIAPEVLTSIQDYFYDEAQKRFLKNLKEEIDIINRELNIPLKYRSKIKEDIISRIIHDENIPFAIKYSQKHKAIVMQQVLAPYAG